MRVAALALATAALLLLPPTVAETAAPLRLGRVYVVRPDGKRLRMLPTPRGVSAYSPAWSRDGGRIAFVTQDAYGSPAYLWTLRRDGRGLRSISTQAFTPAWAPDGQRLAIVSLGYRYDGGRPPEIRLIPATGRGSVTVLRTRAYAPAWSPDGTTIAYVRGDAPGIWASAADGRAERLLASLPPGVSEPADLEWRPDGRVLALSASTSGGRHVFVVGAEGSGWRDLTRGPSQESSPSWAPNGKRLALIRELPTLGPARTGRVVTIAVDGTGPQRLVRVLRPGFRIASVSWSARNELAFAES